MIYVLTKQEWLIILVVILFNFVRFPAKRINKAKWYEKVARELPWLEYYVMFIALWGFAKLCLSAGWITFTIYYAGGNDESSNLAMSLFLMCFIVMEFYPVTVHLPVWWSLVDALVLCILAFILLMVLYVNFFDRWWIAFLVTLFLAVAFVGLLFDFAVSLRRRDLEDKNYKQLESNNDTKRNNHKGLPKHLNMINGGRN